MVNLIKTKDRVEWILKNFEKARNSDSWLICKYWAVYYPTKINRSEDLLAFIQIAIDEGSNDLTNMGYKLLDKYFILNEGKYEGIANINLKDITELQSSESIRRTRQKLQNEENKYLPTDPEVRKERQISEEIYRNFALNN